MVSAVRVERICSALWGGRHLWIRDSWRLSGDAAHEAAPVDRKAGLGSMLGVTERIEMMMVVMIWRRRCGLWVLDLVSLCVLSSMMDSRRPLDQPLKGLIV